MKRRDDILKILRENPAGWCDREVQKAIKYVSQFPPNATLKRIARKIPERWAYEWAREIGDREIMKKRIHSPQFAFFWSHGIGEDIEMMKEKIQRTKGTYIRTENIYDREYIQKKIKDGETALLWARTIGDHDIMRTKIRDPLRAHIWARDIGDREYMRGKIRRPWDVYWWMKEIGDIEIMKKIMARYDKRKLRKSEREIYKKIIKI